MIDRRRPDRRDRIDALAVWIERFISDGPTLERLFDWRELLRLASGLTTTDAPIEPLPAGIDGRVREAATFRIAPSTAKKQAIGAAGNRRTAPGSKSWKTRVRRKAFARRSEPLT